MTCKKTLYDKLVEVMKSDLLMYSYYEDMVENHEKYMRALMTHVEMMLNNCSESSVDEVLGLAKKFREESSEFEKKFLKLLNKKIKLKNIKNVHGYTEFDLLKWDFKSNPWTYKIKYKPKNVAVSFWHCDPKDICYETT